ncbi:hypothetical protein BCD67_10310 [Oscillatoriales cyanobacterium USR001]|nr:hypothetical protein BCD67_10310 [Oscillatoriales cyanobacterium USR001]
MTMYIPNSQSSPPEVLPTMYDLPSEDPEEPGLPDEFHDFQPELLRQTCRPPNYPLEQMFVASDMNLYYDSNHFNWYKRPDWFLVLGASRFYQGDDLRLSYVMWQEKISPLVVVELLSDGTENEDLGLTKEEPNKPPTKWRVYEEILQIPYYFVFSRYTNQLRVFRLIGNRYREQTLTTRLRFWIPELELGIGLWEGFYEGRYRVWLRWYNANGDWILTSEERVEQERLAKESAIAEKEIAMQKAERLAERLRSMGINPDDL